MEGVLRGPIRPGRFPAQVAMLPGASDPVSILDQAAENPQGQEPGYLQSVSVTVALVEFGARPLRLAGRGCSLWLSNPQATLAS